MKPKLNDDELALLQAWIWEHAHGQQDGPAHRLAKENLGDLFLVLLVGSPLLAVKRLRQLNQLINCTQPQIPRVWPWPDMTPQEILRSLQHRVEIQDAASPPWAAIFGALVVGVCLDTLLFWAGLGLLVAAAGAVLGGFGLYVLRDEFKRWLKRSSSKGSCQSTETRKDAQQSSKRHPLRTRRLNDRRLTWETTMPGETEGLTCRVCGEPMEVVRNCDGDRYVTGAIHGSGSFDDHDFFYCRHVGESWHDHAVSLMHEASRSSSATIKKILHEEIESILKGRGCVPRFPA